MSRTLNVLDQFSGTYRRENQEYEFALNILEKKINPSNHNDDFFEGVLKDTFGHAIVSGRMDADSIYFTIKYSDEAINMGALEETLQYNGQSEIPGVFKGTYHEKEIDTMNDSLGTFSMTRLSATKTT